MRHTVLKICDYGRRCLSELSWTKYIYTCCLWFTNLTAGMIDKQIASALPDIQQRTHVQFAEASLYLSVLNIGSLVGSVMTGLMYGRLPHTAYLCFGCTLLAVSEAALPWCNSAVEAYVVNFVIGFCHVAITSFVVAELCALWGNNVAVPMLINALFNGIGGITCSAVIAPFLSTTLETANSTTTDTHRRPNLVEKLYIPFTISAILTIIAAVSHFILLYKSLSNVICIRYLAFDARSGEKFRPYVQRILVIVLIGTSMIMIGSLSTGSYFLPYFLVKQAHLSMSNAAYSLCLYSAFQIIGRFIGFILVIKIGDYRLLLGYSIIYILDVIGLWNCVTYNAAVSAIFITGTGTGFGISVLQASMNSYVEETFMPVTGSVAGFLYASCLVGEVLMSAAMGYFIDTVTPLAYIYGTIIPLLFFVFSVLMTQYFVN